MKIPYSGSGSITPNWCHIPRGTEDDRFVGMDIYVGAAAVGSAGHGPTPAAAELVNGRTPLSLKLSMGVSNFGLMIQRFDVPVLRTVVVGGNCCFSVNSVSSIPKRFTAALICIAVLLIWLPPYGERAYWSVSVPFDILPVPTSLG